MLLHLKCTVVSLKFEGIKFRGFTMNGCFDGIEFFDFELCLIFGDSWAFDFVTLSNFEIHEIKCPTNFNESQYMIKRVLCCF